jgi:hypothetical protein
MRYQRVGQITETELGEENARANETRTRDVERMIDRTSSARCSALGRLLVRSGIDCHDRTIHMLRVQDIHTSITFFRIGAVCA